MKEIALQSGDSRELMLPVQFLYTAIRARYNNLLCE